MSSTTREGQFYGVWPLLDGKPLQLQWGEIRSNTAETKAIVRGSFQDVEDGADSLNALRALIGLAFGEEGFDNRYRLMYNKANEEFCAQRNEGTEAVPSWVDVWCIRFSDGQFQVTSEGGIQSNAGFYGPLPHDMRNIGEVGSGGNLGNSQFPFVDELYFNTDHGFYISAITSGARQGKPIVNFAFPFGKSESFPKNGRVWQVDHDFNATPVLVQAMNDGDVVVIPDKVDVSDPNTAWFYFNEVTSGKALIATGGTGAVELVPSLTVTDGISDFPNVSDLNFNQDRFYLSTDLEGDPVVNLSENYIPEDGSRDFTGSVAIATGGAARLTLDSGPSAIAEIRLNTDGTKVWRLTKTASDGFQLGLGGSNNTVINVAAGAGGVPIDIDANGRVAIGLLGAGPDDGFHVGTPSLFDDRVSAESFYLPEGGNWSDQGLTVTTGGVNVYDEVIAESFYLPEGGNWSDQGLTVTTGGVNVYDEVIAESFYLPEGGNWSDRGLFVATGGARVNDPVVAEAFYLEPGSGGGLWKSGDDVVLDSSDASVVLTGDQVHIVRKGDTFANTVTANAPLAIQETYTTTGVITVDTSLLIAPTVDVQSTALIYSGIDLDGEYLQSAAPNPTFTVWAGFNASGKIKTEGTFVLPRTSIIRDAMVFENDGGGSVSEGDAHAGLEFKAQLKTTTSGDVLRISETCGVDFAPKWNTVAGSTIDFGDIIGFKGNDPDEAAFGFSDGTEEYNSWHLIHQEDLTNVTPAGFNVVIHSELSATAKNLFVNNIGGALSRDTGEYSWVGGGKPVVRQDSVGLVLGAGDDIEIYWDGSDLVFDPASGTSLNLNFGAGIVFGDAAGDFILGFQGHVSLGKELYASVSTETQYTADQDNLSLSGGSSGRIVYRLSSDASRTITGIASETVGRVLFIQNVGSNDIVFANQNASSSAANRIITGTGADLTVSADESITLFYDTTTSRWRVQN